MTNTNQNPSNFQQVVDGTTIGRQDGETNPTFWIWRSAGSNTEYWAYFNYGQQGGFTPLSSSNPNASWSLEWTPKDFSDFNGFVDWITQNYGASPSEITLERHDMTLVPTTDNDLTPA